MMTPFVEQILQSDPVLALKLRIIAHLGLLPTDTRVKEMTDLQWLVMARCLDEADYKKGKDNFEMWCQLLGLTSETGYVPLSFYVNPEMAQKIFRAIREEDRSKDSQILGEEESEKLEDIMQMDIDGMLTDEDREQLRQQELDARRTQLELAGVKIGDE